MAAHVKKRKVFYIPGYDPILPRRYRELYRKESAAQAKISGYHLTLKGVGRTTQNYGWSVEAQIEGLKTHASFEFLHWADIVQASMKRTIAGTYWLLVRTAWIYIATGTLFRLMRLRIGPIIAALYPVVSLLLQLMFALGIGYLFYWGLTVYVHWVLGGVVGLGVCVGLLMWFRSVDGITFVYYLMHDYAFSAQYYGETPPELRVRMSDFADRIHKALQTDVDEVLVVGHSSGAHLAISILADILRRFDLPPSSPKLAFLSLGQVVPMVSFLPRAWELRKDLQELCQSAEITWVDVTAPGDGATFALCDPVAVSGAAPKQGQKGPLILSAAFTQTLSKDYAASLKTGFFKRFFRMHFQYLCHFDRPRDYDYFQITAGPLTLAARYKDRAHSPSRITRAVNRYTHTAAHA